MISLEQGLANYTAHGTNLANCLFVCFWFYYLWAQNGLYIFKWLHFEWLHKYLYTLLDFTSWPFQSKTLSGPSR